MFAFPNTRFEPLNARAKRLGVAGALLVAVALLAGAWLLPVPADAVETTEAGETASVSINLMAAGASVQANIPLGDIQDGQFCQAYGVVHGGGSPPYHFEWDGQFDNSDIDCGWCPLGPNQVVNGSISSARAHWLRVRVWEDDTKATFLGEDTANLQIDWSNPVNPDCAA